MRLGDVGKRPNAKKGHAMEFGRYLQTIRMKEKEIIGHTSLKRVDIISIARRAVAKNKTNDQTWLAEQIRVHVNKSNAHASHHAKPKIFILPK